MKTVIRSIVVSSLALGALGVSGACNSDHDDDGPAAGSGSGATASLAHGGIAQRKPPLDLAAPPDDAVKTTSGLRYKTLVAHVSGAQPTLKDTAVLRYTGWRPRTGETFFTTEDGGNPIAIDLAHAAPGFAEALPMLHKGEKAVLWVPPSAGTPEPLVYEVELVDVVLPQAIAARAATADPKAVVGPRAAAGPTVAVAGPKAAADLKAAVDARPGVVPAKQAPVSAKTASAETNPAPAAARTSGR